MANRFFDMSFEQKAISVSVVYKNIICDGANQLIRAKKKHYVKKNL